ncbi:tetratricopeptide repeat protein, partial [candidate division KSB1 bacterium]|nr:tetratricopeptide repeat protein [candidate division KSB1 bacterium]
MNRIFKELQKMLGFGRILVFTFGMVCLPPAMMAQTTPASLRHEAQKHISAGRYGEAIAILSELINQHPEMAEAYDLRGQSYENRGQFKYAIIDYKRAVKLAPQKKIYRQHLERATRKHRLSIRKRIEKYKRELKINPKLTEHYFILGKLYEELDNWQQAEEWYGKYFELSDLNPEKVIRYAEILANNNRLQKGEQVLRKYLTRYPNDHKLISRYGYFLLWLGKYQQAIKMFERALEIKPFYQEAQEGLAQAKGERFPGARPDFEPSEDRARGLDQQQPRPSQTLRQRYLQLLNLNPNNNKIRLQLIRELMKEREYEQAAAHAEIYEQKLRAGDSPQFIDSLQDSL